MQTAEIDLVTFAPAQLAGALALSRQAAWPHRLEDWRMALALSQGVAALDATSRVVGTALVTPYAGCATINMVIVDETMRGQGLGRRLMDRALALAGDQPLRLVATREGLPLYEYTIFGRRERGVMADEVEIARPDAVTTHRSGFKMVDYSRIGSADAGQVR